MQFEIIILKTTKIIGPPAFRVTWAEDSLDQEQPLQFTMDQEMMFLVDPHTWGKHWVLLGASVLLPLSRAVGPGDVLGHGVREGVYMQVYTHPGVWSSQRSYISYISLVSK